jgi:hypothetical protein
LDDVKWDIAEHHGDDVGGRVVPAKRRSSTYSRREEGRKEGEDSHSERAMLDEERATHHGRRNLT